MMETLDEFRARAHAAAVELVGRQLDESESRMFANLAQAMIAGDVPLEPPDVILSAGVRVWVR